VQVARAKLLEEMSSDLQDRLKENAKLSELTCNKSMLKLFEEIGLPDIKSPEMIGSGLIEDKKQEFSKKYLEYLEANRAPAKYIVFTKKFPTLIFDYFGKLIARIKGVYTDEINKLKSYKAEVDSLNRILKEQGNLILEKDKEVQTLNDEKDELTRQLKTSKELSTFQEQSEKMSKNDLKRTLEDLKRQVLELDN
jgi:hypothetical protein